MSDRNFDDLAPRFARNIYSSMKGRIRLAVLQRDFEEFVTPLYPLEAQPETGRRYRVLDIGAGQGQFALSLAETGCEVLLNDVSANMLAYARAREQALLAAGAIEAQQVRIIQGPAQALSARLPQAHLSFDILLCHAVIEWVEDPLQLLQSVLSLVKPGAYVSLIFYNYDGLAFKNLLRANYTKFDYDGFTAFRGSLTPSYPRRISEVKSLLQSLPLQLICESGIRTFHDYILDPELRGQNPEAMLQRELEYSRRSPFREMARYLHFLAKKTAGTQCEA